MYLLSGVAKVCIGFVLLYSKHWICGSRFMKSHINVCGSKNDDSDKPVHPQTLACLHKNMHALMEQKRGTCRGGNGGDPSHIDR